MTSRTYLDHAATTPMIGEAVEAMTAQLGRVGNASSLHTSGRAARRIVEEGRELIAGYLGARPAEVIFTSGGTESDNLAVKGGYWTQLGQGRQGLVTTAIEHAAVLDSVGWLAENSGAKVDLVPVDSLGVLDGAGLGEVVTGETAVVSVMWANNEVGTTQPIRAMAELAHDRGALAHSDAVQAVGHLDVNFAESGLDLLTFTGHKLGGPYGIGALLARREVTLTSVLHGGGQERDVRSGTLDVAAVAGFAAAVQAACESRETESRRLRWLRGELVAGVRSVAPDACLQGTLEPTLSLPGVVSLRFPGCSAEAMVMLLDAAGVDCATGSACSAGVSQPSHVLLAMGYSEDEARSSIRFSLGHTTTDRSISHLLEALPQVISRARAAARFV